MNSPFKMKNKQNKITMNSGYPQIFRRATLHCIKVIKTKHTYSLGEIVESVGNSQKRAK